MKKIICTISLVMLTALFAEVNGQTSLKFGFQISPMIAFPTMINDDNNRTRKDIGQGAAVGFKYGLVGYYYLGENYAFHTGVSHVVSKGYTTDADTIGDARVTGIEIPVGLKLRSNELTSIAEGVYFRGVFGVSLDFNTGYKRTPTVGEESRNTDEISPFATTFFIGAGMEKEFDFGTFEGGITYHQGLMNINSNDNKVLPATILKLHYLSLDIAYLF